MNACVSNVPQKSIDDGAVKQHIPSGPCRLPEDNVRDSLAPREFDQRVRNPPALQFHYSRSQLFREADVFLKHCVIERIDAARFFFRSFDVNCEPI